MSPDISTDLAHLHGQIDGAIAMLQWGMAIIGALLTVCIGMVAYTFKKLAAAVTDLSRRAHRLDTRVVALETWQREHVRAEER